MKKAIIIIITFLFVVLVVFVVGLVSKTDQPESGQETSAQTESEEKNEDRELLFQVSTINALLAGSYDGQISVADLKEHGNIGVGTFNKLDGEMVVLDGAVYKAKSDGTVEKVSDEETAPFAAVTYFDQDRIIEDTAFSNFEELQKLLNPLIENQNLFYTFKISGDFSYVKVRSVPSQEKPYPPLSEVTKNQAVFEYQDVKGTVLGFWCPEFVEGINVPGYHLHFISDDKTKGGHLLDISAENATVISDQTPSFEMVLPESEDFGNLVLHEDKSEELNKVEQ